MGFRFRKSIKVMPGVRVNIGKKSVSSLSVGPRGAKVNVGRKGTRTTVGIPGSGLSYSRYQPHSSKKRRTKVNNRSQQPNRLTSGRQAQEQGGISFLLGVGIFIMPYIFAWFTLRNGYTTRERLLSFVWMIIVILFIAVR